LCDRFFFAPPPATIPIVKAVLILLALGLARAQSYRFTELTIPGAEVAVAAGINNSGQIAGTYYPSAASNVSHGFLRNPDGSIISFDVPGCANTRVGGINNLGAVVGWCDTQAFLRTAAGVFTTLDLPERLPFYPSGINDRGDVVGYIGIIWAGGVVRHADGTTTAVQYPGMGTEPVAINNRGDVAGSGLSGGAGGTWHGFVRSAEGVYTHFDLPGTSAGTGILALNNRGQIAGSSPGAAFVSNADGSFTLIPGYNIAGMNDAGLIVGARYSLTDPAGSRPVIGTPDPTPLPPTIRTALPGVLNASAFGGASAIAPGTWIEIYGNTLGGTLTNVSVSIAGRPAIISYVSPGQVNALVPADVPPGAADVVVTTPAGKTAPYSVKVEPFLPSVLLWPLTSLKTSSSVMAFFPDWSYVVADHPARAGNTIVLFAMGLGPDPRVEVAFQSFYGKPSLGTVTYAGPVPGMLGLDQINVMVPDVELYPGTPIDNYVRLTVTVNGKTTEAATGRSLLIPIEK
jgi:uncharacterized protein (TIGR03437 family)